MSAKSEFKKKLKKLIKHQGFKSNEEFGELVGMSASKIQRLCDTSKKNCNGALDLDDADAIATALNTTLGYLTGNAYTDYMLNQTLKMRDELIVNRNQVKKQREYLKIRDDQITRNLTYYDEILDKVDALQHRNKIKK